MVKITPKVTFCLISFNKITLETELKAYFAFKSRQNVYESIFAIRHKGSLKSKILVCKFSVKIQNKVDIFWPK